MTCFQSNKSPVVSDRKWHTKTHDSADVFIFLYFNQHAYMDRCDGASRANRVSR